MTGVKSGTQQRSWKKPIDTFKKIGWMYELKKITFCLLCALSLAHRAGAQEKEWHKLTDLLQKEARYFEGKSGFIQLTKSEYNVFTIQKLSISDTMMVSAMWLKDRFGNEPSERYVEETIPFFALGLCTIRSAEVFYNYNFYFEDFPEAQFLLMEFEKETPLVHQTISIYKDLKTGKEEKTTMEDRTHQILIPIRNKSREKIFSAIDDYQRSSLKPARDKDRTH
jgi:hypothetical protein